MQTLQQKIAKKLVYFILLVLCLQPGITFGEISKASRVLRLNSNGVMYSLKKDKLIYSPGEESTLNNQKSSNSWKKIADTYRAKMYKANKNEVLKYADSMLWAAQKTKDNKCIGEAYLTKGVMHYNQKELNKALDNYLLADQYIIKTKDQYNIHKTKYAIANTKYYLGFYHEAKALLKECLDYFEEENDLAYLNTIYALGLCYNKMGEYNKTTYYNKLGLKTGKEYQITEMEPYFKHSEGINLYFKKNYNKAISHLNETIPFLKQKKDFANETVADFYIGKSYLKLNNTNKAINYFIKVDKAFAVHHYTRPDLRENHEILINHFSKQQNTQAQLKYINNLLKIDSTLSHNYKYLSQKIHKDYDTKKLLEAKNDLEQSLITNKKVGVSVITVMSLTIVLLFNQHVKSKKRMKQKFDEFMRNSNTKIAPTPINYENITLDINPELVESILKNLEKFEEKHKYLEKDMTMVKLAPALKTNAKYAAKVILKYRGKKSIDYITDLKIDYIINLLKTENKYRNYTNKALAEEVGFNSTQKFTKAFKQKTEMSPTFFIQQLKKS
ncbi:AraC family transcriptional regulator [Flavobacterium sp.]|uniref:AraC family transcriptional regulator n=1 Tax=Flavobacterium sp. TaxID=239 RepID=UPI0025EBE1D7|nr:AraC family transcriptional regulator [Flavobacterium sp.]